MIVTKFEEFCQNCTDITPIVCNIRRETNFVGSTVSCSIEVTCENMNKCQRLYDYIKKEEGRKTWAAQKEGKPREGTE